MHVYGVDVSCVVRVVLKWVVRCVFRGVWCVVCVARPGARKNSRRV